MSWPVWSLLTEVPCQSSPSLQVDERCCPWSRTESGSATRLSNQAGRVFQLLSALATSVCELGQK